MTTKDGKHWKQGNNKNTNTQDLETTSCRLKSRSTYLKKLYVFFWIEFVSKGNEIYVKSGSIDTSQCAYIVTTILPKHGEKLYFISSQEMF